MFQVNKPVRIQALIPQPPDEALGKRIFYRFSGPDEIKLNSFAVGPFVQGTTGKLRSVIDGDDLRESPDFRQSFQYTDDSTTAQGSIYLDGRAFPGKIIDDRQGAEPLACNETVSHEVHRPFLIRSLRQRNNCPGTGSAFSAPFSPQRQSFSTVNPLCPFMVNHQAFPFQQDVQPGTPESLPLLRQLPQAVP
jgi:hypothetical protein